MIRFAALLIIGAVILALSGCSRPQDIFEAAQSGDRRAVQRFLDEGVDINGIKYGETALHVAAENGNLLVVELLISRGAKSQVISMSDGDPIATPLGLAAERGHCEVVSYLLTHGADVDGGWKSCATPLCRAAGNSHLDVMKVLISRGADVNVRGGFPLVCAAGATDARATELLFANGANVKNPMGLHAVQVAVRANNENIARLLIAKGAKTNLFTAAGLGDVKQVREFLNKGIDVNIKDDGAYTPLHWAAEGGKVQAADLLIREGADVNATNSYGFTPLHLALRGRINGSSFPSDPWSRNAGNPNVAKLLIAKGAKVNAKVKNGYTPMYYANAAGYADVVELLRKRGATETSGQ